MKTRLTPGQTFPSTKVTTIEGKDIDLAKPAKGFDWRLLVVYRGKHCPICTNYLRQLNELNSELNAIGVDVVAVSADSLEKAKDQISSVQPEFDVGYGLTTEQMTSLGLFISNARPEMNIETPFAEPGLFVINEEQKIQILDISNAPFTRPELNTVLMGLKYVKNPANNYATPGTYAE